MIPLGTDRLRARPPVVTFVLIGINVAVFAVTWPVQQVQEDSLMAAGMRLCYVEAEIETEYLTNLASRMDWAPYSCGRPTKAQAAFWRDWRIGNVEGMSADQVSRWQAATDDVEAAKAGMLYWQWGFHREGLNVLAIVTAAFLHAGIWHLLGNMTFLWAVGANVEDVWGSRSFLLLYALGILASTAPGAFFGDPRTYTVGASGAVAAAMGAFAVRHWRQKIRVFMFVPLGVFSIAAWWALPAWFALEVAATLAGHQQYTGVAHAAHAAGFATGAAFGLAFIAARVEEGDIGQRLAEGDRTRRKAEALLLAERATARGLGNEALPHLVAAAEADPDDLALRRRVAELQLASGALADARRSVQELVRYLSTRGDHAACLALLPLVEAAFAGEAVPAATLLRLGSAAERSDLHLAAGLLHRAASGTADPATRGPALRRYAAALEELGDAAGAAQVRAVLERERSTRDERRDAPAP